MLIDFSQVIDGIWITIKVLHPTFSLAVTTIALYYGIKYRFSNPKFHLVISEDASHPEQSQLLLVGANKTNKDILVRRAFVTNTKHSKQQIDQELKDLTFKGFAPVQIDGQKDFLKITKNSFFRVETIALQEDTYHYHSVFKNHIFFLTLEYPDDTVRNIRIRIKPKHYAALTRICGKADKCEKERKGANYEAQGLQGICH